MNKTISINLGSIFFHIDEIAFNKLKSYLDDIKLYLHNEESKDEIINDIEVRIAEIFMEERQDEQQVISVEVVEKVIKIMGNPEDYRVDDTTDYQDFSKENYKSYRKLYRDKDTSILGGVSAGFGHYFRIDAIWIRVIFILMGIFSAGTGVIIYIACWLLIPPALTTSEKLAMRGKPINFSNIERKVKENYEKFTQKMDDIDYEKYKAQTKSGAQKLGSSLYNIFEAIGNFIKKFLGVILIFIAGVVLLSLVFSLFGLGSFSFFEDTNYYDFGLSELDLPIWAYAVMVFFSIGIPFFYLLILGLKLLINNLRKIGKPINISLFTLWIIAVFSLIFFSIKQNLKDSQKVELVNVIETNYNNQDTLNISMNENLRFNLNSHKNSKNKIVFDESNQELTIGNMINLNFIPSNDSLVKIRVEKSAYSTSKANAKALAKQIDYGISTETKNIKLNNYFSTLPQFVNHRISIDISILLPEGIHLKFDESVKIYKSNYQNFNEFNRVKYNQLLQVEDKNLKCLTCPEIENDSIN